MKDLNPSMGEGRGKLRSQLIIVDRTFDLNSIILHELTFQAMAYDNFTMEKKNFNFTDDNAQNVACFEERDILWTQIRHQHICHAVTVVNEKLKNCVNSLRTLTLTVGTAAKSSSVWDMSKSIKMIPELNKEKEKCSRYISELQKCMDLYGKDLVNICGLEQNLVMSGITFGADFTDFLSELKSYLNNVNVSTQNKMRLIILFILHKGGLPENIFNEFIQIAQLSPTNIQTIMNLNIILGFCTTKKEGTKIQLPFGHGTRVSDEKFPVSPWTPLIKNLMENCIENKLDPEQCPFVGVNKSSTENHAASSSRYTAPNAMWHKPKASTEFQGSRVIIYILGGVTYSEMRCAYEVSNKFKNWEIIIGSSNPLTPNDFIQNLSELNKPPH
ncbi:protein ROP-like [Aphis gossypii]|uniref:protein ROP-like n=1 Tax=Aphis gossypii TaxID=80765 RepID=UPI002158EE82|nr:protein ROP-like [Aphis gossypii]